MKIEQAVIQYENKIEELGVEGIMKPLVPKMELFDWIDMGVIYNRQADYNSNIFKKTVYIKQEGVYYTFFIYELLEKDENPQLGNSTGGAHRLLMVKKTANGAQASLLASNTDIPHLELFGSIEYKNTIGYLNAE